MNSFNFLVPSDELVLLVRNQIAMTLDEAKSLIKTCASRMNERYGQVVFDEWAIVSLAENRARVLFFIGPRHDDFLKNFVSDLGGLRAELSEAKYGAGDLFDLQQYARNDGNNCQRFALARCADSVR